jgi:hypothetical protein
MRFKTERGKFDIKKAMPAILALDIPVYAYRPEMGLGDNDQVGLYAEQVCAIDDLLCHRDAQGVIDNYDKVGALAIAFAAIKELQAEIHKGGAR